jgi:hypothetical protein
MVIRLDLTYGVTEIATFGFTGSGILLNLGDLRRLLRAPQKLARRCSVIDDDEAIKIGETGK